MQSWLTVHFPLTVEDPPDASHEGVWIRKGAFASVSEMAAGDLVFVYETVGGEKPLRRLANGTTQILRLRRGRGAVVALLQVLTPPSARENPAPDEYASGKKILWEFHAPTVVVNSGGRLDRSRLTQILGFKPNFTMRKKGGIWCLSSEQARQLLDEFLALDESRLQQELSRGERRMYGPGGEGPDHLALKEYVAENAERVLGEAGLRLIRTEYGFATGDEIDVLFRDALGRPVVVEIKVDCDDLEVCGPLQCAKYRALLALEEDRVASEVRAILVAHSIAPSVSAKCRKHGIACVVFPRSAMKQL